MYLLTDPITNKIVKIFPIKFQEKIALKLGLGIFWICNYTRVLDFKFKILTRRFL